MEKNMLGSYVPRLVVAVCLGVLRVGLGVTPWNGDSNWRIGCVGVLGSNGDPWETSMFLDLLRSSVEPGGTNSEPNGLWLFTSPRLNPRLRTRR